MAKAKETKPAAKPAAAKKAKETKPAAKPAAAALPKGATSCDVVDRHGKFVRTYSVADHGSDFAALAKQFVAKHGGKVIEAGSVAPATEVEEDEDAEDEGGDDDSGSEGAEGEEDAGSDDEDEE